MEEGKRRGRYGANAENRRRGFWRGAGVCAALAVILTGLTVSFRFLWGESLPSADGDRTIYYFYDEACAGCDRQGEFLKLFEDRLSGAALPERPHIQCFNLFSEGEELWEELCDERNIPAQERTAPMVIAGDGYAIGEENIRSRLRELACALCGVQDTGTIRYYYRPDCRDCIRIEELLEKSFKENPELSVIRIDTNDPAAKEAFKEKLRQWEVPEDKWQVPFVDNGRDYLSGDLEIEEKIKDFLRESMPVLK